MLMACLGKIIAGVVSRCLSRGLAFELGLSFFHNDHVLFYRHGISTPCQTNSISVQHPSYGDCLEVKREYYQNSSVLDCLTQCSQSAAHSCEQFLQVKQIVFVALGPLRCA